MASLVKLLRGQGYEMIDGPIRDHKVLQVWIKKGINKPFSAGMINEIFSSPVQLISQESPALYVNSSETVKYDIGADITGLEELLKSANLGNLGLSAKIKGGKEAAVGFSNAKTVFFSYTNIVNYLSDQGASFTTNAPDIINNANKNNLILITGILYAQNLTVKVKTTSDIKVGIEAELNQIAGGKAEFTRNSNREIAMTADLGVSIPIAVHAFRLKFLKGKFRTTTLITDYGDVFK